MTLLTKDQILHVAERPSGYKVLYEFCKSVQNEKAPNEQTLELVADAMWLILTEQDHDLTYGLDLFADKLKLKWGPGEKPAGPTNNKIEVIISAVLEYQELVNTGNKKIPASERIAPKYRISGKTLRTWAREHKSEAEATRQFYSQMKAHQKNN